MKVEIKTLEELRRLKNISFDEMEKEISRQTYYNIIRGTNKVSENTLDSLTKIFGISKEQIVKLIK